MKLLPPPTGWLLGYPIFFTVIAFLLAREVSRDFSTPILIEAIGFLILAALLWLRTPLALVFNAIFAVVLISLGGFVLYRTGTYGHLVGGFLLLVGCWTFRDDIESQNI
ncbi:hypothetical protein LF1_54370 [Rubripirellula obstinata]|uniref:Uncharacterized protein n=1 Tax=Rubripirellula obstinata TaxID=406547 RepID=A0A5B1C841_9BACT|nr:hypothetical protein [Rubripirellula obstinata]KAA1257288.1 hypothetical protein LF1_54370 [Rubripirellula obstinata]